MGKEIEAQRACGERQKKCGDKKIAKMKVKRN